MLCSFTGYDEASNPVFGEVPAADPSYIATVNVAEDKEKAVNNNYELISLRGQTGGGMTDLQIRTSKTTTQIANKLRNVEYSEENVRSNIQALYDAMEEKNSSYSAAKTAYDLLAGSAGAEGQWHAKQHPVYAAGTGMASGTVRI